MSQHRLVQDHDCEPSNIGFIGGSLTEYNASAVGYSDEKRVAVFFKDGDDNIVAGLIGSTYWDWLDISLLWVREDLRRKGLGSQLLAAAEQEALDRGCRQALLDTFSFQSPDFYFKHGYEVFGEVDGFAGRHSRYYMRKRLA